MKLFMFCVDVFHYYKINNLNNILSYAISQVIKIILHSVGS